MHIAGVPFGVMMDATLLSHKASSSHPVVACSISIGEVHSAVFVVFPDKTASQNCWNPLFLRNSYGKAADFAESYSRPKRQDWGSYIRDSRTIAGNLPNHGSNDLTYSDIPLRAAMMVLAGGVDTRSATLARPVIATMVSRNEGIKLPC